MKNVRLAMCTLAHLITDFATVAYLYALIAPGVWQGGEGSLYEGIVAAGMVLAYDTLAFGLQPLIGILVDRKNCAGPLLFAALAAIAVCNVAAAFGLLHNFFAAATGLVIVSVANAVFHISAGAFVVAEGNGCAPLGVFVGAGALGVALGKLFSCGLLWIGLGCLLCASGLYFAKTNRKSMMSYYEKIRSDIGGSEIDFIPLALLCAGVLLRGFCGTAATPAFSVNNVTLVLIAVGAALGKVAGGFLADRIGIVKTVAICVPAGALLTCFGAHIGWLYATGVALFNVSMPITLYMAIRALPRRRNFAFGVLAALLMAGSMPAMIIGGNWAKYSALALAFVSVIAIVTAEQKSKKIH